LLEEIGKLRDGFHKMHQTEIEIDNQFISETQ
jgi:hypothetical protein